MTSRSGPDGAIPKGRGCIVRVGAAGTYPGRRVMRQPRRVAATPVIPFGAPPLDPLVLLDGRE